MSNFKWWQNTEVDCGTTQENGSQRVNRSTLGVTERKVNKDSPTFRGKRRYQMAELTILGASEPVREGYYHPRRVMSVPLPPPPSYTFITPSPYRKRGSVEREPGFLPRNLFEVAGLTRENTPIFRRDVFPPRSLEHAFTSTLLSLCRVTVIQ